MIEPTDLQTYISLFETRHSEKCDPNLEIRTVLFSTNTNLYGDQFGQITKMLAVKAYANEVDMLAYQTAKVIYQDVRNSNCSDLSNPKNWRKAIQLAEVTVKAQTYTSILPQREVEVAGAYKRLKSSGRKLSINANGIHWDPQSLKEICSKLDSLVRLMGGRGVLEQIGHVFEDQNNIYDKIWLCGEKNLGVQDSNEPEIPYGWLRALALKHTQNESKARKPKVLWKSIIDTARDVAATFNCQRYSQFDGFGLTSHGVPSAVYQALCWRELFTVQQIPQELLPYLKKAFLLELEKSGDVLAKSRIVELWAEFTRLRLSLDKSKPTLFNHNIVHDNFPNLLSLSNNHNRKVNEGYKVPMSGVERNDTSIIFYLATKDTYLTAPISQSNTAFLKIVFLEMYRLLKDPNDTLSDVTERVLALASAGKADTILSGKEYTVGKKTYEFDLATQSGPEITLMEIKNKPITKVSESGDGLSFLEDISKSAYPLILQLARHEKHIRKNLTPLNTAFLPDELSITKFAVSTLTYGAITDKMFLKSVFTALSKCKLGAQDSLKQKTVEAINSEFQLALDEVIAISEKNNKGLYDITPFFIQTRWIDMGQLVYLLSRSKKVSDATRPIKHLTFASRDVWSEIAYADRGGLTNGAWSKLR